MVHNGYLHAAVSSGLPAVVLYLALIGSVLAAGWRRCRSGPVSEGRLQTGLLAAIVGYLVQDLSGWLEVSLSAYFWVLLGLCAASRTRVSDSLPPAAALRGGVVAVAVATVAVVATGSAVLGARSIREWSADAELVRCRVLENSADWRETAACLESMTAAAGRDAYSFEQAALIFARRADRARDRGASLAGVTLLDDARRLNPFDSLVVLRRLDLETIALSRGLQSQSGTSLDAMVERARALDPANPLVDESAARLRLAEGKPETALALVFARSAPALVRRACASSKAMPEGPVETLPGGKRLQEGDRAVAAEQEPGRTEESSPQRWRRRGSSWTPSTKPIGPRGWLRTICSASCFSARSLRTCTSLSWRRKPTRRP